METGAPYNMDLDTYGRSPLECGSFVVSSAYPDESMWGTSFLARLSGSTAEFLSMWIPGQEKGDSTSLQRGCSRSDFQEESIHALRSPREMTARPKMSQNEWKTTEIRASKVGNVSPFSCPGR